MVRKSPNRGALTLKLSAAIQGFKIVRLADGYSPATLAVYQWALERLQWYLDNPEVDQITEQNVQSFFAFLRTDYDPPLAGASIENVWKAVRSFYNWASDTLPIHRPDSRIPRPRYAQEEIQPYTREEVKALLRACEYTTLALSMRRKSFAMKRPTAFRDRAIVLLLLDTGVRASELCRLTYKDINLESGTVHIQAFGSGRKTKSRTVYFQKHSRAALWKYLSSQPQTTFLFTTSTLATLNRGSLYHMIDALGERSGVLSANVHKFRHTFAIQYLRNGGDVFTLQRLLGHASLEMVRRYLSLADNDAASVHKGASPVDNWL